MSPRNEARSSCRTFLIADKKQPKRQNTDCPKPQLANKNAIFQILFCRKLLSPVAQEGRVLCRIGCMADKTLFAGERCIDTREARREFGAFLVYASVTIFFEE